MFLHTKRHLGAALPALAMFLPFVHAQAPLAPSPRGAWMWYSPRSEYGSLKVIGDPAREAATIAKLKSWGVGTLYVSYPLRTEDDLRKARAWNAQLARAGITSYLLLSDTPIFLPENHAKTDAIIQSSFVQFNAGSKPEERFRGLAFDLEPHIILAVGKHPAWKDATGMERRAYLADLLSFYKQTRSTIGADTMLEATLPVWLSHIGGSVAWASPKDRDDWFKQLAATCDRVSLMAFEQNSAEKVLARSQEQRDLLGKHSRVALRANLGKEWASVQEFWQATASVEKTAQDGIDIQDVAILSEDEAAR
ncbi:hypothetical protein ACFQBQ_06950 [Granulicella cerasi]|uniref:Uncharacterized protein n=1 Tax=Granulicella cerasi TaxID=741063 RepID=A0ABW1Z8V6_9BACT|nr:hypothetical protein [Granulicella cerasi]